MSDDKRLDLAQRIADAVYEAISDTIRGYAEEFSDDPDGCIMEERRSILEAVKEALK